MPATPETPVVPQAPFVPGPSSDEERDALAANNRMRDYFATRPKVSIKTREDEWVQVNGYTFIIKGGERVQVPDDIANILEESGRI